MPEPICAGSCACPCVLKTPQQWKLEIESNWNNNVDATFIIKQPPFSPCLNRIPFRGTTAGVKSKHNQTLRSVYLWSRIESSSLVAISNYLLRASVHCAGTFPFHHYTQAALIQSQPAAAAAAATQQTVSSVHRRGTVQAAVNSSFCLGKDSCLYKPQVQWGFFSETNTVKRGQGNTRLPLGYVCHNYSVGQLSPSLIKR